VKLARIYCLSLDPTFVSPIFILYFTALSDYCVHLANSPDELELIRLTFEALLNFSARATKVQNKVLEDILFLLDVRSDALGDDWVLDLLARVLKQQPASASEALTCYKDAEIAITEVYEAIRRTQR
jgi:hypothetical protein